MSKRTASSPPTDPPPTPRPQRGRLGRRNQSGVAALEFALVIPMFIFVLYGLITFGVILAQKQQITNAAADGARSAVGSATLAAAKTVATDRVHKSLGPETAYHLSFNEVGDADYDPTIQASGACGTNNCITVRIRYDYGAHPTVPPAPGLGLVTPSTFRSVAVVQYA